MPAAGRPPSSGKSIAQVAAYRSLTRCGVAELTVHAHTANTDGGLAYARKKERDQKDIAREALLEIVRGRIGMYSILTMPGVEWRFENKLLGRREGDWVRHKVAPERTSITSIENDRVIFHGALMQMPGMNNEHSVLRELPRTGYAERSFATSWIDGYHFGNVDDLMAADEHTFDAAWLDYTGPLSSERMRVIKRFFKSSINDLLIITHLKARWNKETSEAIDRKGGWSAWVRSYLPGTVLHECEYQDGHSPMAQIVIEKVYENTV